MALEGRGTRLPSVRCVEMRDTSFSEQAEALRKRAAECRRRALLASEEPQRRTYLELADLWRDMAQQVETLYHRNSDL
jgi:hypothetical protein